MRGGGAARTFFERLARGASGRARAAVGALALDLVEVVARGECAACPDALGRPRGPLCPECVARWSQTVSRCELCSGGIPEEAGPHCPECAHRAPRTVVQAPSSHAGVARSLVHALKYGGRREIAALLARRLLADAGAAACLARADVLVPAPGHPRNVRERGFDVAPEIARELARALEPSPLLREPVVRAGHGPQQVGATASRRRVALRGTLRERRAARRWITGRSVVIVDDVVTTGATCRALAHRLRRLGARDVAVVACTRAPRPVRRPS